MTLAAHLPHLTPHPARPADTPRDGLPSSAHPDPTAVLAGLTETLAAYRTCELATVTKSGTPVAWPAVSWYDRNAGRFVLTTSIGAPRKAFNIRHDARVTMLFSDPTGSGREDLPQVHVHGTAHCPDEIRTSPQGLETYWRELWRRQPGSSAYGSTPLDRWLFDFYYMRLVITVKPVGVTIRPPLSRAAGPLAVSRPARRDHTPYGQAVARLRGYSDGVLATVVGDGPPVLRRVRPAADLATGAFLLEGASPAEVGGASSANLLLHRHDDQLARLRQFGLVGALETTDEHVRIRPTRLLAGAEATTPVSLARTVRRLRRTTQRYLDHRGLSRPAVPWAEYRRLASES